jgi:2-methylfumaryl-CoA isomerase
LRTLDEIRAAFEGTGVSWGPYQTFRQLVDEDPRCALDNPMFQVGNHPGVGNYLMPGSPLHFSADHRPRIEGPPALGGDTAAVLREVLGLSDEQVATFSPAAGAGLAKHQG